MSSLIGALRVTLGLDTAAFEKGATAIEKRSKKMERSIEGFGRKMQGIGQTLSIAVTAPLVAFGVASVKAATESRDAMAQVEASLKSMGGAAGRTKDQLADMASGLMRKSLYDDDEILRKVTANLLTFGNISGKVFDQAQQAAVDLSAKLGSDLQASTILVGKALNNPVKGVTALTRVGVEFTKQQIAQIKAMSEAGDVAGAQAIIVAELKKQYGGSAEAALKAAGPMAQIKKRFDELSETVGKALLPAIERIVPYITRAADAFLNLSPGVQTAIVAAAGLAAALGPLLIVVGSAVQAMAPFLAAMKIIGATNGPLIATRAGLIGITSAFAPLILAVGAGYFAWKNWDTIAPILEGIGRGLGILEGQVSSATGTMVGLFEGIGAKAVETGAATKAEIDGIMAKLGEMRASGKIDPVALASIEELIAKLQEAGTIAPEEAAKVRKAIAGMWTAQDQAERRDTLESAVADFRWMGEQIVGALDTIEADSDHFWALLWQGFSDFTKRLNGWGAEIQTAMQQAGGHVANLYYGVKNWIGDKLSAVLDGVRKKIAAVGDSFHDLYIRVVGNSDVPDMIDGIAMQMARLDEVMVAKAKSATAKTGEAFRQLAGDVRAIMDEVFPDVARLRESRGKVGTIDAAEKARLIDADMAAALRNGVLRGLSDAPRGELDVGVAGTGPLDVTKGLDDVLDSLDTFKRRAGATTVSVAKSFKDMADATMQSLSNLANSIKGGGFLGILEAVIGLGLQLGSIGAFGKTIAGRINAPRVPGYAGGTNFHPGGLAVVGERGPELVDMPRGSRVYPNGRGPGERLTVEVIANNNGFGAVVRNYAGQVVAEAAPALMDGGAQVAQSRMNYRQTRRVA